jgi:hypothetical protein
MEKAIQSLVAERAALMGANEISFDAKPTMQITRKFALCKFKTEHNTRSIHKV